jgi:integrase
VVDVGRDRAAIDAVRAVSGEHRLALRLPAPTARTAQLAVRAATPLRHGPTATETGAGYSHPTTRTGSGCSSNAARAIARAITASIRRDVCRPPGWSIRDPYKPGAIRGYEQNLRRRVLPALGHERLREITLPQLQRFVDRLASEDLAAATITTAVTPLRAIYRRARQLGEVQHNPTAGLSVPAVNRRQSRFATAEQIEAMLARLDSREDRALWATALYAGLRRGELQALHREDVDLASGVIRVERGWDDVEGEVPPKSKQGRRKVPIPAVLRDRLAEYLIDGPESGRIFAGIRASYERGREAAEATGVEPPTLHECRHGYAALMIAAGVNVKALSTYMGHANIGITLDQYGHLLPGAEDEAADLLDAFLARQVGSGDAPTALQTAPHPVESES